MLGIAGSHADDNKGNAGSARAKNLSKMAASAFLNKPKYTEDENEPEGNGGLLDQRRINEIFVRLKVSEMVCLFLALLGIGSGVIDYEISYYDTNEAEKDTRIILECFCMFSTV